MSAISLGHYLSLGGILFAMSVLGIFLNRKNLIILLMAIELMLLAVNLNLVAFSTFLGDIVGQVFGKVRQLVGIHLLGGREDFRRIHVRQQAFADRVGDFQQDFAITIRLDQVPDAESVFRRQRIEDVGDVGRMQGVDFTLQVGQILLEHQIGRAHV